MVTRTRSALIASGLRESQSQCFHNNVHNKRARWPISSHPWQPKLDKARDNSVRKINERVKAMTPDETNPVREESVFVLCGSRSNISGTCVVGINQKKKKKVAEHLTSWRMFCVFVWEIMPINDTATGCNTKSAIWGGCGRLTGWSGEYYMTMTTKMMSFLVTISMWILEL